MARPVAGDVEERVTLEQRVRAAVDEVVAATDPEQIVLFGSVAKRTAGAESDIDLLVIGDPRRHADQKRTCARTGDQVDVFVTDRATAERHRYSAAYLESIALEEGRTVYAKHPEQALAVGERMVGRTLYDPDNAVEWVTDARDRLRRFETDREDLHKCESLGDALEQALKALIVASGQRVAHRHRLRTLRRQAEATGGPLPGGMADGGLDHLTKYTGKRLYPAQGARELDPRAVWERLETPIREVVAYAERRVPELVSATWKRITAENRPGLLPQEPERTKTSRSSTRAS